MIRYKLIEHERSEDAPFIGALISAIDCHNNCKNCFNQHIKRLPNIEASAEQIILEIKKDPFNQGVILAGLEWTEQPMEMQELIECAIKSNLQVMLYTGLDETTFKQRFADTYKMPIYIKFGRYDESLSTDKNLQYGVKLASSNQYIHYK